MIQIKRPQRPQVPQLSILKSLSPLKVPKPQTEMTKTLTIQRRGNYNLRPNPSMMPTIQHFFKGHKIKYDFVETESKLSGFKSER